MGRENVKNIQKNKQNLLLFGGEIQNLGGEFPPLKALKKKKKHCTQVTKYTVATHIISLVVGGDSCAQ